MPKRKSNLVKLDEVFTSVSEDARAVYLDYVNTHYRVPVKPRLPKVTRVRQPKADTPKADKPTVAV